MTRTMGTATSHFLDSERQRVDAALRRVCAGLLAGAPTAVAAPIRHALDAGGKRLRPILCVEAYRAVVGGRPAAALYELAAGLELLHTYSLMHDDLPCMDDDDLRRGRPAAHRVFGVRTATVAAAALIPLSFRALDRGARRLGLAAERRQASIAQLSRAAGAGGMVGGQLLDLEAEGAQPDRAALQAVHARKTGALIAAACRIGAIAGGADDGGVEALGRYGEQLGLAFQIADDVLDETGRTELLGKTAGRDRERAKATFTVLLGVDAAQAMAHAAAAAAVAALRDARLDSPRFEELARFAVERDR